jgi:hypothetical protein
VGTQGYPCLIGPYSPAREEWKKIIREREVCEEIYRIWRERE